MYSKKNQKYVFTIFLFLLFLLLTNPAFSDEYNSSNFKVLDPVMDAGGFGSSASFNLIGVISQISSGESTASSFGDNAGFVYYPQISLAVASATAGDGQVALSWTTSLGALGWASASYSVGMSTTAGGPYSYTSLGNVTTHTVTGLTNSTTYYFVVATKDAFGNVIATSAEVSATPVAAAVTPPSGGGGGGGGGGGSSETGIVFSGRAYPLSKVTILKDAQIAVTTIAGPDSKFKVTLGNLSAGSYNFAVYGEDRNGIRSSLFTFPIYITSRVLAEVSGIFITPTISVDKSEVKRGDNITIFGQSSQVSEITVSINSAVEYFVKKNSDADGIYLLNFDSSVLEMGQHSAKSKSATDGEISSFGKLVGFTVGTKNVMATVATQSFLKGDLNNDKKVNLVDFSIGAFWYKRALSEAFSLIEKERLNGDGKFDLVDFSIMAYYWTG